MRFKPVGKTRNLGIIMRDWDCISQVWLHRSIECLEDHIAFIASFKANDQWNEEIPGFNLTGPKFTLKERIRYKFQGPPDNIDRLRRYIKKSRVDKLLIHFADMALITLEAWLDLDVEVFVYCHGYDIHFDARNDTWPYASRHPHDYAERVFRLSDRVTFFANSQHTQNKLQAIGVPAENIQLIYYGVELPEQLPEYPIKAKDELLNLLFLGRLVDFKGPDLVIKSFEQACKQGLNAKLTIAGDGNLMPMCQLLVYESPYGDRIQFVGPVDRQRAAKLFAEADIFVNHQRLGPLSNREEAFGVTMLEAMSRGLPVLTTRSGGIEESVIDGETGFLVETGSLSAFVDRLLALAGSPETRKQFAQNGRRHIKKNFPLERQASQLLSSLKLV
ncbi:MAG: glycosyltransferase family 4 protein [Cyanothece sp. SIO1E1]|nr:glycosyltransferase family 4 protein [Cyanothece sp. SIO1E1]